MLGILDLVLCSARYFLGRRSLETDEEVFQWQNSGQVRYTKTFYRKLEGGPFLVSGVGPVKRKS